MIFSLEKGKDCLVCHSQPPHASAAMSLDATKDQMSKDIIFKRLERSIQTVICLNV